MRLGRGLTWTGRGRVSLLQLLRRPFFIAFLFAALVLLPLGSVHAIEQPATSEQGGKPRAGSAQFWPALPILKSQAAQGDPLAQYRLGFLYEIGQDVKEDQFEAVQWFRRSAEGGLAAAQLRLGVAYIKGIGIGRDYKAGIAWQTKAAEQGNTQAQRNLGRAYTYGEADVEKNLTVALEWYRKAANLCDVDALTEMGVIFSTGRGPAVDYVEAYKWFALAAQNAVLPPWAALPERNRDRIAAGISTADLEEAKRRASQWVPVQKCREPIKIPGGK